MIEANKGGRPRKHPRKTVNALLVQAKPVEYEYVRRVGRPRAVYFGQPVEFYVELICEIRKLRGAPPGRALLKLILARMKERNTRGHMDITTLERALRRHKSRHN